MGCWLYVALVFCKLLGPVLALRIEEKIDIVAPFEYLGRFAGRGNSKFAAVGSLTPDSARALNLQAEGGLVNFTVTVPTGSGTSLLVYDDYNKWKNVALNSKTPCWSVVSQAKAQIDLLAPKVQSMKDLSYFNFVTRNDSTSTVANGCIVFQKTTWAILILANCDASLACTTGGTCQGPMIASASLVMTNGIGFDGQFSLDEVGIFWCAVSFFVIQLLLFVFSIYTRRLLVAMNKGHPTVRLLVAAVFLQLVSLFFSCLYWLIAGTSGVKVDQLFILFTYLTALSNYLITILLIFLGKGLTISRNAISPQGGLKIVAFATTLLVCLIFAEAFASWGFDSTTGLYLYASSSGILLILLRCVVALAWFLSTSIIQMRTFAKKRRFYKKFITFFGIWLAAPVPLVLISISIDPINTTIFTFIWDELLTMSAQLVLLLMYCPNSKLAAINQSFPFHKNAEVGDSLLYSALAVVPPAVDQPSPALSDSKPRANKSVSELYVDIRGNAIGVTETIRMLGQIEKRFYQLLDDWMTDAGADLSDDD